MSQPIEPGMYVAFRRGIQHPECLRLFDYWTACRGTRRFPGRADMAPGEMKFALGRLVIFDVLRDPLRFRFRLIGTDVVRRDGRDLTGRFVDEMDEAEYRNNLLAALRNTMELAQPTIALRAVTLDENHRRFVVLRLPLADDGENIDRIMTFSVYVQNDWDALPLASSCSQPRSSHPGDSLMTRIARSGDS